MLSVFLMRTKSPVLKPHFPIAVDVLETRTGTLRDAIPAAFNLASIRSIESLMSWRCSMISVISDSVSGSTELFSVELMLELAS